MVAAPYPADAETLVRWAAAELRSAGIESARLEAQLILAIALSTTRTAISAGLADTSRRVNIDQFERLVCERARRVPLAYLRGTQEFYGLEFSVGPCVLIPRPETEILVECALEWLPSGGAVLGDAGTGSGCIAIAALAHRPTAVGVAFDIAEAALCVARGNAIRNGVADRLRMVRADMLSGCGGETLDVVVSNPPYIASSEIPGLQAEVRDWEPAAALDGGPDGLAMHRVLSRGAHRALRSSGRVAIEVAVGQAPAVAALLRAARFVDVETLNDLAGIERVVTARKA